jgi:hypothetical protein
MVNSGAIGTKRCTVCGLDRPATKDFWYWNRRDKTWQSRCIPCRNAKVRKSDSPVKHRQKVWDDVAASGTRTCTLCGVQKSLNDFTKSDFCVQGRTRQCKTCNQDRKNRSRGAYVSKSWAKFLLTGLRSRIRSNGYEFDLTEDYIKELWASQDGRCYWFQVPLVATSDPRHPQKPSLDRLVPEKGYVQGNVVLTCLAANLGRNVTPEGIFRSFVSTLRSALSGVTDIERGAADAADD